MDQSYYCFSAFVRQVYNLYMSNPSDKSSLVSKHLNKILLSYLEELKINKTQLKKFKTKLDKVSKKLLKMNQRMKKELIQELPHLKHRITDLNSAVMGVANDNDSDIDITIAVNNSNEQKKVGKVLKSLGYELTHIYNENKPARMKWHTFHKYIDNIEIEVKVRSIRIVKRVLITSVNVKNNLTPSQKLKVSFIKSILSHGDKRTYKTFKYILYGAMFEGHKHTVIFRHSN